MEILDVLGADGAALDWVLVPNLDVNGRASLDSVVRPHLLGPFRPQGVALDGCHDDFLPVHEQFRVRVRLGAAHVVPGAPVHRARRHVGALEPEIEKVGRRRRNQGKTGRRCPNRRLEFRIDHAAGRAAEHETEHARERRTFHSGETIPHPAGISEGRALRSVAERCGHDVRACARARGAVR